MRLRYSKRALTDLDEIWVYLTERTGSAELADRVIDSITQTLTRLRRNPLLGRSRANTLNPRLRSIPTGKYVIYYRVNADLVEVYRIFHGSRNPQKFLT